MTLFSIGYLFSERSYESTHNIGVGSGPGAGAGARAEEQECDELELDQLQI